MHAMHSQWCGGLYGQWRPEAEVLGGRPLLVPVPTIFSSWLLWWHFKPVKSQIFSTSGHFRFSKPAASPLLEGLGAM